LLSNKYSEAFNYMSINSLRKTSEESPAKKRQKNTDTSAEVREREREREREKEIESEV